MTIELITTMLKQGRSELTATILAMPEDKLNWKPLDNGRSALDLFGAATQSFGLVEKFTTSGGAYQPPADIGQQQAEERAGWTREEAIAVLERDSDSLIKALANFSDEQLGKQLTLHLQQDMVMPLGAWLLVPYRACISRFGQINYIQTLYGDFEFHN